MTARIVILDVHLLLFRLFISRCVGCDTLCEYRRLRCYLVV